MKFLLKVALLVAAAKFILMTPEGKNPQLDQVGNTTVRQIARHVDVAFTKLEKTIKDLLS